MTAAAGMLASPKTGCLVALRVPLPACIWAFMPAQVLLSPSARCPAARCIDPAAELSISTAPAAGSLRRIPASTLLCCQAHALLERLKSCTFGVGS